MGLNKEYVNLGSSLGEKQTKGRHKGKTKKGDV